MNKVILIGRLTKDPEVRYSQSADPVAIARYTLAVDRRFKKEGQPDADFIGCVAFGKTGEFAEKYLKKGMKIAVTGRLSVNSYDDANGQRRWAHDVVVEEHEFTESRSAFENRMTNRPDSSQESHYDAMAAHHAPSAPKSESAAQPGFESEGFSAITESIDDDDLPF
jgi:single-strand DNA-binding protein